MVVGSSFRDGRLGGQRYRALRTFIHPNYALNSTTLINDVAIVRTISEIQFNRRIQPIKINSEKILGAGTLGVFTGWGFIGQGRFLPEWSDRLQKMDAIVIGDDECFERFGDHPRRYWLNEQTVCTLSREGTSVCGG